MKFGSVCKSPPEHYPPPPPPSPIHTPQPHPRLPQENDTLPAFYSSTLFPLDVFSFPSSWPGCERFTCTLRIHTTVCPSIHPSVRPGLCSLTRVWFQAESTPCKTSRSQRLHWGSREGRGGAWPGFILGRLLCSWASRGLGAPGHHGGTNGRIYWLMIVFPLRHSDTDHSRWRLQVNLTVKLLIWTEHRIKRNILHWWKKWSQSSKMNH